MEKYLEVKRVLRGLRIHVIPNYDNTNPSLLQDWAGLMADTCHKMIEMLVKYATEDLLQTKKEIEELQEKFNNYKGVEKERITEVYKIMTVRLDKLEKEIKERKRRKFLRDKLDYEMGRVLTFNRKFDAARYNSKKVEIQQYQERLVEDMSSDISSDSDVDSTGMNTRSGVTMTVPDEYR